MSQREKSERNALVDRYLAVWHEPVAELRRKRIADLWVEDGVQFTPSREIRGYQALEERVEAAHEEEPRIRKTGLTPSVGVVLPVKQQIGGAEWIRDYE